MSGGTSLVKDCPEEWALYLLKEREPDEEIIGWKAKEMLSKEGTEEKGQPDTFTTWIIQLPSDTRLLVAILYKLKLGQSVTTIPTVGFNVETVTYKNVKFNVWDVGGQDKIRPLWRHYYTGTQGLIFVVDCADRDRIDEARQELHRIINDREMRDAIILIFANKQDLPDAMKPHEIQEKLGLTRIRDRNWYVQPSCATTGDGLYEGLTWLTSNHKL
uniref:ADP-ribosylation factor 6 n=1 Tax=Timema poppense TaxID=170557 RepID=A0A7R9GXF5_TIMPO|nr:unnamed protein product [Timema poppensis]